MKRARLLSIVLVSLACAAIGHADASLAIEPQGQFLYVYAPAGLHEVNHYSPSGWIGDSADLKYAEVQDPTHPSDTCVRITYTPNGAKGWASIYWQNPPNNWGGVSGGFDLSKFSRLTFQARGAVGGEKIGGFKMGGIEGVYGDTDSAETGPVDLTREWKKFTVDLKGKDLTRIIGGFCVTAGRDDNPNGFTIYLKHIRYEP